MTNREEGTPQRGEMSGVDADSLIEPALLDRMTDAFLALDDEWRLTYLNEQAAEMVRNAADADPDEELVGRDVRELLPEFVDTEVHEGYVEAMESQSPVEFETRYEPLDAWLEVRAYPSASGLSAFVRDVTEEHDRRERLRMHEEALTAITEVFVAADRPFDERVSELLGIGAEMLDTEYGTLSRIREDRYVFEVVYAPDDSVEAGDAVDLSATNCERVVLAEESLALADVSDDEELAARVGHAEWGISCYLGAPVRVHGSVYGTFCFYDRDAREEPFEDWQVTLVELMAVWVSAQLERQVVEEDLRRQNDRLEEFATIVSHDLRNPLAVAKGQTELAAESVDDERLEKAARAHERMERIISDVLTMARTGSVVEETEPVDLSTAAPEAWSTVDTAAATLDASDAPSVRADRSRLVQLLENLFRNAVEHGGDDVHVTVGRIDDPDRSGFYVADDGPGIPEGDREAVFDHGYTTHEEGTGFGLSIVRGIATAHGWTASATASGAGGARFEFLDVESA
ncbi:sensor histidine kinase [Halobaculum magnesiiphilum]|uniref:histidine kinase n=1 Tax=Halobaculum magnesiiphilum TaxID=1017351 RepID=A0A8T8WDY2_9EURY|nr:ATP-binding protein [Halobaculum magnesiiphilum]QZP38072.1 PAS domain-containing protein [Halobaculum magnesiiphilum]